MVTSSEAKERILRAYFPPVKLRGSVESVFESHPVNQFFIEERHFPAEIPEEEVEGVVKFVSQLKRLKEKPAVTLPENPDYYFRHSFGLGGPMTAICKKNSGTVGFIEYLIGFPIVVITLQGTGGKISPLFGEKGIQKEFYKKTGKNFYNVLIDDLLARVDSNFPLKRKKGRLKEWHLALLPWPK